MANYTVLDAVNYNHVKLVKTRSVHFALLKSSRFATYGRKLDANLPFTFY